MSSSEPSADDLNVSLDWPEQSTPDSHRRPRRQKTNSTEEGALPPVEPATEQSEEHFSVELGTGTPVVAPLAAIAIRVEALNAAMSMMRVALSDGLEDLGNQLSRAAARSNGELEEYRRQQARALDELRNRFDVLETTLARGSAEPGRIWAALELTTTTLIDRLDDQIPSLERIQTDAAASVKAVARLADSLGQVGQSRGQLGAGKTSRGELSADRLTHSAQDHRGTSETTREQLEVLRRLDSMDQRIAGLELSLAGLSQEWQTVVEGRIIERIEALSAQVLSLRRRTALRARSQPLLDVAAIDTLAESIAQQLRTDDRGGKAPTGRRRRSPS